MRTQRHLVRAERLQFARYTVTAESDAKSRPLSLSRRSFRVLSSTPHTSMSITAPYTVFASWMEIAFTHTGVSKSATHSTCVLLTVTRGLLADTSAGGAVVVVTVTVMLTLADT